MRGRFRVLGKYKQQAFLYHRRFRNWVFRPKAPLPLRTGF
jgi:hypothetical protein